MFSILPGAVDHPTASPSVLCLGWAANNLHGDLYNSDDFCQGDVRCLYQMILWQKPLLKETSFCFNASVEAFFRAGGFTIARPALIYML